MSMLMVTGGKGKTPIAVTSLGVANNADQYTNTAVLTVGAGGVPAGSLIVIISHTRATPSAGSVTDSVGNTYTGVGALYADNTPDPYGSGNVFYAYNSIAIPEGGTIYFTRGGSESSRYAVISGLYAVGILATSNPIDSAVGATQKGSTNPSMTSGIPSVSGELFIAAVGGFGLGYTQDTSNGWSVPPEFSTLSGATIAGGYQVNSGVGTKNFSPTGVSGAFWARIVGFKPE